MNIPIIGRFIDERFLEHRRRSTSLAGIIGAFVAIGLWAYRYIVDHVWNWELFAVAVTIAVVKVALMIWYSTTD
ncbi:MAG: hypothetical protein JJE51_01700 [Thermoanaerobaculia bacterium]|nr:hypothetical protein [Thermoanaerobaculia bacterium]